MTLSVGAWLLLAAAALVVGISKTSIGGLASLAVAAFAMVLPAKESTAAVLLLLITGDIVAVLLYRKQADWSQLKKLLPAVIPGIVLGAVFMKFVSDQVLLLSVAACLLIAVGLQVGMRVRDARRAAVGASALVAGDDGGSDDDGVASGAAVAESSPAHESSRAKSMAAPIAAGVAAGFTTMVANAAGAVMALYLLAIKADKARFVATGAWFFFLVNLSKVPFSIGLGLIHTHTLIILAAVIPVVLVGTWIGRTFLKKLKQGSFEWLTIAASALSAIVLLLKGLL
ncbi:MAG: sulfite exporter TauE/SafE family protein [Propionibacteriaceae bacterium]|jgi:uncharacterized membrane protein YfcA|nr:sulfite exporter TauE/SafE family protein [Propionibacteriaceae bacterium]